MVKLSKRLFSLLTVLVICLSIVPMKVVAEVDPIFRPDYKFTNQPEGCIFDSRTSEYTVTWLTDFLVDCFVVYKVISGPAGRYEEIAREPLSYSLGGYTFKDLTPDDAGTYLIKVYPKETDTGVPLSVDSEPFELKYADNYFTVQPQSGDITTDLDYTVTWETNFVPTKVELLEYGNV
ncbi:MAG: immunoglobulin domain-containing protein [Ruminococcus sp.]|nr:immunoglobulin domain-containing protein [Ruminococcus sp.]